MVDTLDKQVKQYQHATVLLRSQIPCLHSKSWDSTAPNCNLQLCAWTHAYLARHKHSIQSKPSNAVRTTQVRSTTCLARTLSLSPHLHLVSVLGLL